MNSLFFRCFNGGQCIDGVDTYNCNCQDGYFGNNCECPPEAVDDPSLCLNVNESVSWEVRNRTIAHCQFSEFSFILFLAIFLVILLVKNCATKIFL